MVTTNDKFVMAHMVIQASVSFSVEDDDKKYTNR